MKFHGTAVRADVSEGGNLMTPSRSKHPGGKFPVTRLLEECADVKNYITRVWRALSYAKPCGLDEEENFS